MNRKRIIRIRDAMYSLFSDPITVIHEKSGAARSTISRFFNCNPTLKPSTRELIYNSCLEVVEEKVKEKEKKHKRFDNLLDRLGN